MVIINLWPYAMRHANDVANATPRKGQELSPLEIFSGVQIAPELKTFSRFWVPNIRIGQRAAERARSTQVEEALTARCIPRALS